MLALLDAGPMIALFDPGDALHQRFRNQLAQSKPAWRLHTSWPCITEASHMLEQRGRFALLRWVGAGGVHVFPFAEADVLPMAQWMERYSDSRSEMDFADASLYWMAVDTGVNRILTTDVRDFSRYRLPDGRGFEIL